MAQLLKLFHTGAAQIRGFPREFVTLRVAPIVLFSAIWTPQLEAGTDY